MDTGNTKTKKLHVHGMTCISCQNKIERKLRNTVGIQSVDVSYSAGTATVDYDPDAVSLKNIELMIEKLGYQVRASRQTPNAGRVIGFLIIIIALYVMLEQFGVLNLLVPAQLAQTNMGYGMLFVIGLITSIHCIAMCGGINLSQCIPRAETADQQAAINGKMSRFSTFVPAFLYNLGRVISYTIVGFILGFAGLLFGGGGSNAGLPVFAQGILKLLAGIFMVIMGINMLGIFPWLRKLQPRMPKIFARKVNTEKARSKSPFIVGLLNGLMPCGPLQSMQIVALASGNPLAGALSMFFFSMGTVPLMLGLGSIVSALGKKFTRKVMNIGAVLVVVLGISMLSQGGSLSGLLSPDLLLYIVVGLCVIGIVSCIPFRKLSYKTFSMVTASVLAVVVISALSVGAASAGTGTVKSENIQIADGKQLVNSTLSSGSYPDITVQAGTPVKWVINAPEGSINGCNNKVNIPEYGISNYSFKNGENVIEFTPDETGQFQYSCWMGMIRGTITVMEAGAAAADTEKPAAAGDASNGSVSSNDPNLSRPIASGEAKATVKDGVQYVTSTVSGGGYQPITVQQGIPVKWTLNAPEGSLNGCNKAIVVPEYDIQVNLKTGDNQIEFTPDRSGTFTFSCWMGMVRSTITVAGEDGTVAPTEDDGSNKLPSCCG